MDLKVLKKTLEELIRGGDAKKKIKVILLIGISICLMFVKLPQENKKEDTIKYVSNESISNDDYKTNEEKRIEEFLEKIDGIKEAKVLLSMKCGKEKVIAINEDVIKSYTNENDGNGGIRQIKNEDVKQNTIYKSDNNPFVLRENEPEASGVVILVKGNLSSEVKSYIIESMKAYLQIATNKIQVYKMKG